MTCAKRVLDMCCGPRMFWFNPAHEETVFCDIRSETHVVPDKSSAGGRREIRVRPDVVADFRELPFARGAFDLVVFDPPHFVRNGGAGWVHKKYGTLAEGWESDLRRGFSEAFRVLKPGGFLVFKWNESDIRVSRVLALAQTEPLFGHKSGKNSQTHWMLFTKSLDMCLREEVFS